jgi:hypothetical protein
MSPDMPGSSSVDVLLVVAPFQDPASSEESLRELFEIVAPTRMVVLDAGGLASSTALHAGQISVEHGELIATVNSCLGEAAEEYVALVDAGFRVEERGSLAHACAFLASREDVAIVGFGGWHSIGNDGWCHRPMEEYGRNGWRRDAPAWRFTRVAAARSGFVCRASDRLSLDESFGDDISTSIIDLGLACHSAGRGVYSLNLDHHGGGQRSPAAGGQVLAARWAELLPMDLEYPDERESAADIGALNDELLGLARSEAAASIEYHRCLEESMALNARHDEVASRARALESEISGADLRIAELEARVAAVEARKGSPPGGRGR